MLGSRTAETLPTRILIIHGPTVSRPVKVSCREDVYGRIELGSCNDVLLIRAQNALQLGTAAPPLVMPMSTMVIPVCPKCGTTKKSGKLSCCARDGSWFKKCGNAGDKQFHYTWAEGVQACQRKLGKEQNLRRSLWWVSCHEIFVLPFMYVGGTTKRHYVYLFAGRTDVLHHARIIAYPLNATLSRNATQQETTNFYRPNGRSNNDAMNSEDRVGLAKLTVYICVSFSIFKL